MVSEYRWEGRVMSLVSMGEDLAALCLGPSQTSHYVYPLFKNIIIPNVFLVISVINSNKLSKLKGLWEPPDL